MNIIPGFFSKNREGNSEFNGSNRPTDKRIILVFKKERSIGEKLEKNKGKGKGMCGQGIMEYIILSSFIGIFCLVAMKQFGSVLEKRIQFLKSQLIEHMKMK